jgi:hypothetical protein
MQDTLPGISTKRTCAKESDVKYTPAHATWSLLRCDVAPPRKRPVIEPCAGDGAIVRVLQLDGYFVQLAVEIRREELSELKKLCTASCDDWIDLCANGQPRLIDSAVVTNPPFSLAREIAMATLAHHPVYMALLLRCNTIGSSPWSHFWNSFPPTAIRTLKERPSYTGNNKTDAAEYMWAVWQRGQQPINLRVI